MMRAVHARLERRSTVFAACAACLLVGLFFIFIWTPLPWGWKGLDDYYDIGLRLAQGEPFPTMDVMAGYAYFLACFYRLFGDRPWVPLCAQVLLNACIPLMLYHLVRRDLGERIAVMTAVLAGLFSFNTVYASTQASDAICTVLAVATMLCFARAHREQRMAWFATAGLLAGLAWQFRPNLVLFPPFLAALYVARYSRARVRFAQMTAFVAIFAIAGVPWIIRNYQWSGLFVPASTHGAKQLWFGTLQVRQYQESWLYNPRAAFEFSPVEYTNIIEMPVVITAAGLPCETLQRPHVELVYWTNRDRTPRRLSAQPRAGGDILVELPTLPAPTAVYYYFDVAAILEGRPTRFQTPPAGAADPFMIVISRDHFSDLDIDGHALDLFDIIRMLRHLSWQEPLAARAQLDLNHDGAVTEADVRRAAALVVDNRRRPDEVTDPVRSIEHDDATVTLRFRDGSSVSAPRAWSGTISDVRLETPTAVVSLAAQAVSRSRSFAGVEAGRPPAAVDALSAGACMCVLDVSANRVPYRRLPHEMRRFTALSIDNIRHDPAGYAAASAVRALRVFIIQGSEDRSTAYQFAGANRAYQAGRIASIAYFALFVAGLAIAIARRLPLLMLLAPIVYVPLTICFMLINARYSMTTQPFVFAFVAVALVTAIDAMPGAARRTPAPHTAG